MTEPSTGAGGTAVGITTGPARLDVDVYEVDGTTARVGYDGYELYVHTGFLTQGEPIPDHPALPAVAAWLNDNPDGAVELWAHLDDLGEERETPRLRSLRDALIAALTTDGGA